MSENPDWEGTVPVEVAGSATAVAVRGFIHPKAGKADELLRAWEVLLEPMRAESGFEQYVIHTSDDEPGIFFLYERWASGLDLTEHLRQPYMRAFFARLPELLDRPFAGQWVMPVVV